jgi:subtilisin family serine protease
MAAWKLSWHHEELGIAEFWKQGITGHGVTVALLDTGLAKPVGLDRSDFEYLDADGNPTSATDLDGHGTCCASLIASYRGGALGVAPEAKLVSYRVLETGDAAGAVERAFEHILRARPDIDVLSCSFVIDRASPRLRECVRALVNAGKVVIAAAGNSHEAVSEFPEQTTNAITVAAVTRDGRPLSAARTGPWIDLSAPGHDLPALAPGINRVVLFGESSAAAAVMSGVAALALSVRERTGARQRLAMGLEGLLKATARPLSGVDPRAVGAGVVDPERLVQSSLAIS